MILPLSQIHAFGLAITDDSHEDIVARARPLLSLLSDAPDPTALYEKLDAIDRAIRCGSTRALRTARAEAVTEIAIAMRAYWDRALAEAGKVPTVMEEELERSTRARPVLVADFPTREGA